MDKYDERAIKESEKRSERWKVKKQLKEIRKVLNSKTFKDLDFPVDEEEQGNEIEEF